MKSMLTLLFTVALCAVMNAQTTNTEQQAPATQGEPTKKIAYEVVPAKRVVTPTNTPAADTPPADISDIKAEQDKQKVQQALDKRNATQGVQKQEPQKKEVVYDLKDEKPKE